MSDEVVDNDQNTGLHRALQNGTMDVVNSLLDQKPSNIINRPNKKGHTPLHLAVLNASEPIVERIISLGGDVNVKDKDGKTPIYLATEWGKANIVEKLVKGGTRADVNISDKDGNCPLHAAVAINHESLSNFLLTDARASIAAKNNMGRTPLHVLGEKGGDGRILEILLKFQADLNCKDNDGNTPLHLSVGFCHQAMSIELCKRGASVCEVNVNDATCLDDLPFGDQTARTEIQQKMLKAIPKAPTWLPDSASPHCQMCKATFTTKNRRHHCRHCGRLLCGKCTPNEKNITKWNLKDARVCVTCDPIL